MKKIKLYLLALLIINCQLSIINCIAQPNGGFENWSNVLNYETPTNWQTLNFLSAFTPPNPVSAFKASGVDKHSGNYALKLKTIFVNNNPVPGTINDTIGYVFTGKVIISPPSLKLGIPYSGRPEKLDFWAKYIPVGGDKGGVTVILTKSNGTTTDTIANGDIILDSTVLSYTLYQINLNYYSAEMPDTVIIGFTSSYKDEIARVGSSLYLDDVAFAGWVGIDEQSINMDKINIYPNPAKDAVTIYAPVEDADNIEVLDVSGKLMGIYKIQNYQANINLALFAEGIYFYDIRNKKNNSLIEGKFNVLK